MNDLQKIDTGLSIPEALQARFKQNSQIGAEEVQETLPRLTIVDTQSTKTNLLDGSRADVGKFYHTRLKEQWDELEVRLMVIKGCELPDINGEFKKNFLIAGVIDNSNAEFLFYCKGLNYGELFPFFKVLLFPVQSQHAESHLGLAPLASRDIFRFARVCHKLPDIVLIVNKDKLVILSPSR